MRKRIKFIAKSVIPRRLIDGIGAFIRGEGGLHRHQALAGISFCVLIFLLDAFTLADGLASALYILVLVWFAERRRREAVMAAIFACMVLTVATYPFAYGAVALFDPIFRRLVSCAAIVITTPFILNSLRLRDEMSRQDTFLDLTNHPIMVRDATGAISYWNGAAERLYGWSARQAIGLNYTRLLKTVFPQDLSAIENAFGKHGFWEGSAINQTRTGESVIVLNRWFGQFSEDDGNTVLDIGTDITALQHVTEQLHQREKRYRSIFNTVNIGILEEDFSAIAAKVEALKEAGVRNFEGYCAQHPGFVEECIHSIRMVDANESAMRMFEAVEKTELLRMLENIHLREKKISSQARLIVAIAEGETFFTATAMMRTLRGHALPIIFSINLPGSYDRMNSIFVSVVDDGERRRVQESLAKTRESLVHAGQVTALGDMTATIAHQVNHPLAAIIANSEAALRWLNRAEPEFEEAAEAIEAAFQNGISAARVVKHIRSNGGYDAAQKSMFSIEEVCDDSCRLLERELARHDIVVRQDFSTENKPVFGDKIQIEQVVLNLMSNAIEALSNRSAPRELTIRAMPAEASSIRVEVQDNGTGIGEAALAKFFEPLYTTKPSGMGLGLSICRAIVQMHDGKIWATSAAQQGTIIQFTLPRATSSSLSTYL